MASVLSHPAVPLAIAVALGTTRMRPGLTAIACVASVLPDVDALGFQAGIPYGSVFGHRGITHSLLFAVVVATIATLFSHALQSSPITTFAIVLVATTSHGVLDALTTGGLGVAFFAPFSNHRYFLPWRVIRVSPIGVSPFFSEWGLRVLRSELQWVWVPSAVLGVLGFLIRKLRRGGA